MSSSFTYTFRNRRPARLVPQMRLQIGEFLVEHGKQFVQVRGGAIEFASACCVPPQCVGICTVIVISCLHADWELRACCSRYFRTAQFSARSALRPRIVRRERRLSSRPLPVMQSTVVSSGGMRPCSIELARAADRHASCGLGEDAFGLREQLNRLDHFGVGDIFRPAAALVMALIA